MKISDVRDYLGEVLEGYLQALLMGETWLCGQDDCPKMPHMALVFIDGEMEEIECGLSYWGNWYRVDDFSRPALDHLESLVTDFVLDHWPLIKQYPAAQIGGDLAEAQNFESPCMNFSDGALYPTEVGWVLGVSAATLDPISVYINTDSGYLEIK